ncbi:MAG: AbrB/MazE/SpoVT family DNA-binding domain-containing protein [Aeromicrobium sp.]|nr:AbrB/MazE/SpoVT family DNA-binding domain-containing protein [Burkholderiales bacterium]
MVIAQSKITTQGQISIPAEVRKKLGVGPGALIEWDERDDQVVVRRAGLHTFVEVHAALFGSSAKTKTSINVKAGIKQYMQKRHARG